jgi:hypothetical protein
MALRFHKFIHKETGRACFSPAGRYGNFLNSIKKLVHFVRYNYRKYYVVHLTLTVAENVSQIDYKHLHRVLQFIDKRLERAGSDFKYVAVKEQQGRGAVHYHILCVYNKPYVFPSADDIQKSWRLGFIKISTPNFKVKMKMQTIANYIGKYIGKGYEYEALDYKKSFSASQIKQIYKLSSERLSEVIMKFGKQRAEQLKCTFRKVFEWQTMKPFRPIKEILLEFPSEWAYYGREDEPF